MDAAPTVRLDIWLDVACLFRTRAEAQKACRAGKVDVNGVPAKPHRIVRLGDQIAITRPLGRRQTVVVEGVRETHVAKVEARQLYRDTTPVPTPEEQTRHRLERQWRAAQQAAGAPSKRDRRAARALKERGRS